MKTDGFDRTGGWGCVACPDDARPLDDPAGVPTVRLKPEHRERFAVRDGNGNKLGGDGAFVGLCSKHRREAVMPEVEA